MVVWTRLIILSALISCCCPIASELDNSGDYEYEELASTSGLPGSSSASGSSSGSSSGSGSGSADWWEDDDKNAELCSGIIDTNSSSFINSSTNFTFSESMYYIKVAG